jgi:hypothetical protein
MNEMNVIKDLACLVDKESVLGSKANIPRMR